MTRRWKRRRRVLWAGLLLCLVVIVAVLSVVDAGLRIYDQRVSATRDRRSTRKANTVFRTAGLASLTSLAALVLGVTVTANHWEAEESIANTRAPTPGVIEQLTGRRRTGGRRWGLDPWPQSRPAIE